MERRDNLRGAAFMCLGMAGFCLNDTLVKTLAGEMPLFQVVFLRGLLCTLLVALMAWRAGALGFRPGPRDRRFLGQRVLGEIGGTLAFLTALFHMPLAEATAVMQFLPLAVVLSAAVFLGEPVGWRRGLAAAAGFIGVMVILRPGAAGFNAYAFWALAAIGFLVLREVSTRCLSPEAPSSLVVLVASAGMTAAAGLGVLVAGDWAPLDLSAALRLAAASGFLLVGYHFGVLAMRTGAIAFTQTFRYSLLLWAILLGILVFGETPDAATLIGAAILVGAGLFTLGGGGKPAAGPSAGGSGGLWIGKRGRSGPRTRGRPDSEGVPSA